jgi:hypothetical protein
VILPGSRCCVTLATVSSYGAAREATRAWGNPLLAVFSASGDDSRADPLSRVGVVTTVMDLRKRRGQWVAEVQAVCRARKQETLRTHPFRLARVEPWPDAGEPLETLWPLVAAVQGAVIRWRGPPHCLPSVLEQIRAASPGDLPGLVMPLLAEVPWTDWQTVLEMDTLEERLAFVLAHLHCRPAASG